MISTHLVDSLQKSCLNLNTNNSNEMKSKLKNNNNKLNITSVLKAWRVIQYMPPIVNTHYNILVTIVPSWYEGVHAMHTKEKHAETECGNGQEM